MDTLYPFLLRHTLKKYKKKGSLELRRYLITPEQEFVEAACLIAIVEKREIPLDKKLGVMPESYVLGLLDCIGELKRMVFDKIRIGEIFKGKFPRPEPESSSKTLHHMKYNETRKVILLDEAQIY